MLMDDFRRLNTAFTSFIASDRKLLVDLEQEKLALMPMDAIKEDFRYSFGVEMSEALPRFSEHLKNLSKTKN